MNENNMIYFNLMDEMKDDCCPVCALIKKRTEEQMDAFLYESVNDSSMRKIISADRGFCDYHAKELMEMGDSLAHAIIYEDILKLALKDIGRNNFSKYRNKKDCIFCRLAGQAERSYISEFVSGYRKKEFEKKYEKSGMLCLKHLSMLEQEDKYIYPDIERVTLQKYNKLLDFLEEIKLKNDYRHLDEEWTDGAKDSWKRAVSVINSDCKTDE